MIQNYTGETVHLRQEDGTLLTLPGDPARTVWLDCCRENVGETHPGGVQICYYRSRLMGLPPESPEDAYYLVPPIIARAAAELGRTECVTVDQGSARRLPGPIMGSIIEYSRLRTCTDFGEDPEVEADEPVVVLGRMLGVHKAGER